MKIRDINPRVYQLNEPPLDPLVFEFKDGDTGKKLEIETRGVDIIRIISGDEKLEIDTEGSEVYLRPCIKRTM